MNRVLDNHANLLAQTVGALARTYRDEVGA